MFLSGGLAGVYIYIYIYWSLRTKPKTLYILETEIMREIIGEKITAQ